MSLQSSCIEHVKGQQLQTIRQKLKTCFTPRHGGPGRLGSGPDVGRHRHPLEEAARPLRDGVQLRHVVVWGSGLLHAHIRGVSSGGRQQDIWVRIYIQGDFFICPIGDLEYLVNYLVDLSEVCLILF